MTVGKLYPAKGLTANRKAKAIGQNQIGSANQKPVFQILH